MLDGFLGGMKKGKTILMIISEYPNYLDGRKIISNMEIRFPKVKGAGTIERFSLLDLVRFTDKDNEWHNLNIDWDEIYMNLESRLSAGKELNRLGSYLIFQSGKRDIDIKWTSQMFGTMDNRLRWATLEVGTIYKALGVTVFCEYFNRNIDAFYCWRINCKYLNKCKQEKNFMLRYMKWTGKAWKRFKINNVQHYYEMYEAGEPISYRDTLEVEAYLSARNSALRKTIKDRLSTRLTTESVDRFLREVDKISVTPNE